MRHRAFSFSIGDGESGGVMAIAVVAPTAHYSAVHTIGGAARMMRRVASAAEWQYVDAELNPAPTGLLGGGSLLRRLVLGGDEHSLRVAFVRWDDVEIASPEHATGALDAHLKALTDSFGRSG